MHRSLRPSLSDRLWAWVILSLQGRMAGSLVTRARSAATPSGTASSPFLTARGGAISIPLPAGASFSTGKRKTSTRSRASQWAWAKSSKRARKLQVICNGICALGQRVGGASLRPFPPGRAAPRSRLLGPQTTSISRRRMIWPSAFRCHASGVWSGCRSSRAQQSEQEGGACGHYFASLLIASGMDVKVVQTRLRQPRAMTTLNTYGHMWPDADESSRAAVAVVLAARKDSSRTARLAD